MNDQMQIRNFCIIAHIDHGKSTLADRLLEITHTIDPRQMKSQVLDQMDLERERGITIKLQPVRMQYVHNNQEYILNLIDTPGHVDFSYEVSRSLQACEGALLVIDASQGIQAQTLANLYLALEQDLTIIPVLNKIDLPGVDIPRVTKEIIGLLGCQPAEIIPVSAKTGKNIENILHAIVEQVPSPRGDVQSPLRALIFDSIFDDYQGVIAYIRVVDGSVRKEDTIRFMANEITSEALGVGIFRPMREDCEVLSAGEIGYVVSGVKRVEDARVGDTVTHQRQPASAALPGYREVKPMVFAGIYTKDSSQYSALREAMGKLKLNDAALQFEPEQSGALGFGFRCGFLGLLHVDIVRERLQREYRLDVIVTTPSVAYNVYHSDGTIMTIASPMDLPNPSAIEHIEEPIMDVDIVTPKDYLGNIMTFVMQKHGRPRDNAMEYLDEQRVILHYCIPLASLVVNFYDMLKNVTSGYASMNYEFRNYAPADVVRLDIRVADEPVDALAILVYHSEAQDIGRNVVKSLRALLPRQMFEVKIQAVIGSTILASERLPAMRKDVTAKLYGGDVTRKRKLLEKQKKGKKRMRSMGKVDIPQSAYMAMLQKDH